MSLFLDMTMLTALHPLKSGYPVDVFTSYPITDSIIRTRGEKFLRSFDRIENGIRTHAWDVDPGWYMAQWIGRDPVALTNYGTPEWVLYVNRQSPVQIETSMYIALPGYSIGTEELDPLLRQLGIMDITASLPKKIGESYLARHIEHGYVLMSEDQYRWNVIRIIPVM